MDEEASVLDESEDSEVPKFFAADVDALFAVAETVEDEVVVETLFVIGVEEVALAWMFSPLA